MPEWPHAPLHQLSEQGAYIVTAGTYRKAHHFGAPDRLQLLHDQLLSLARRHGWHRQAWAVFSNHYHFIASSPDDPSSLRRFLQHLHSETARAVNRMDHAGDRRVWFTYWDTHLTYERSYLARLQYVHENAVHHGVVRDPAAYEWCSARWFEATANTAFFKVVSSFKTDRLNIRDDFVVEPVI
jgi:putative transposase